MVGRGGAVVGFLLGHVGISMVFWEIRILIQVFTWKVRKKWCLSLSISSPFLLIICEITTHTPLKYRILHVNTLLKVYNLMSLYTYKANFATSSILQEMLLTGMHTASIPQT